MKNKNQCGDQRHDSAGECSDAWINGAHFIAQSSERLQELQLFVRLDFS